MSVRAPRLVLAAVVLAVGACGAPPAPPDRFTALPSACDLVTRQVVQQIVGGAAAEPALRTADSDSCRWNDRPDEVPDPPPQGIAPYQRDLAVSVFLHRRPEGQDHIGGTALAERVFTDQRTARGLAEKVDGIGDEAYGKFDDRSGVLDLRLANLTAELRYGGNGMSRNGATGLGAETIRASLTQAARDVDRTLRK